MSGRLGYFAFFFPPSRASGVYRAVETVRVFAAQGWDVTVFTVDAAYHDGAVGSVDGSLIDAIPSNVEVVRVPFALGDPELADVRGLSWLGASFPAVTRRLRAARRRVSTRVLLAAGRDVGPHRFEDPYLAWIDPLRAAAVDAGCSGSGPFDVLVATGNPFSAFQAARLAAGDLGVPFIVDYRDPWTIDAVDGTRVRVGSGAEAVEAAVVNDAAAVVHVNEPIAAAYRRRYPDSADKHHVVVNGFDRESLREIAPGPADGAVRFGALGTVTKRWALEELIEGFRLARPDLPAGSEFLVGGYLGYFGRSTADDAAGFPDASSGFRYVGPVPKRDVSGFYDSIDVVVVPGRGGPMATSGKMFEAVGQGIPVVVVQEDGGGARSFFEGREATFAAEPAAGEIAAALVAAAAAAATQTVDEQRAVRAAAAPFERSRALETLVELAEACRVG